MVPTNVDLVHFLICRWSLGCTGDTRIGSKRRYDIVMISIDITLSLNPPLSLSFPPIFFAHMSFLLMSFHPLPCPSFPLVSFSFLSMSFPPTSFLPTSFPLTNTAVPLHSREPSSYTRANSICLLRHSSRQWSAGVWRHSTMGAGWLAPLSVPGRNTSPPQHVEQRTLHNHLKC